MVARFAVGLASSDRPHIRLRCPISCGKKVGVCDEKSLGGPLNPTLGSARCEKCGRMKKQNRGQIEFGGTDAAVREFLKIISFIINRCPKPRIAKYPRFGCDLTFSVPIGGRGYPNADFDALRTMLSVRFFADFIAELILRSNLQQFLDHVAEEPDYEMNVMSAAHEHFGVAIDGGRIEFAFHVSRLSELVNEQIREVLECAGRKRS